jgi:Flp pilus assembly protein TadD
MQLKCKKGEVVKTVKKKGVKDKKMCVKITAGIIPDGELYQQGRLLAKQGQYEWALTALNAVQDQTDPHVLNYLGYSNRKAGRLDIAITYYNKALAIDPNFVLAREYLGEGYVAAGKLDLAKEQLAEIASRAGTDSEEYIDLNAAINGKSI